MKYRGSILAAAAVALVACGGARESAVGEQSATDAVSAPAPAEARALGMVAQQDPSAPGADRAMAATDTASASTPGTPAATGTVLVPSMLIRTGQAQLEVDSIDPAIAGVRALAQRLGGYVGNTALTGGRQQARSASLELKLPAEQFEQALTGLGAIGKVESVNATAQDVGEEYVDLQARRTNASRMEQRLLELLDRRTGRLEDVLAVERELARVREEIERFDGRLRYLRTRAAVSTLTVNLHEPVPLLDDGPGANPIVRAVRRAWQNFVGFIAGFIEMLGVLIPLGAIIAALVWGIRRVWRGRKRPS